MRRRQQPSMNCNRWGEETTRRKILNCCFDDYMREKLPTVKNNSYTFDLCISSTSSISSLVHMSILSKIIAIYFLLLITSFYFLCEIVYFDCRICRLKFSFNLNLLKANWNNFSHLSNNDYEVIHLCISTNLLRKRARLCCNFCTFIRVYVCLSVCLSVC